MPRNQEVATDFLYSLNKCLYSENYYNFSHFCFPLGLGGLGVFFLVLTFSDFFFFCPVVSVLVAVSEMLIRRDFVLAPHLMHTGKQI